MSVFKDFNHEILSMYRCFPELTSRTSVLTSTARAHPHSSCTQTTWFPWTWLLHSHAVPCPSLPTPPWWAPYRLPQPWHWSKARRMTTTKTMTLSCLCTASPTSTLSLNRHTHVNMLCQCWFQFLQLMRWPLQVEKGRTVRCSSLTDESSRAKRREKARNCFV